MYIETARLLIRKLTVADAKELHRALGDPLVMQHIETPYDLEATKAFIKQHGMGENPRVYALIEKESNSVMGHVVFHAIDYPEIYELGWIIGQKYWRKGYAYEASKALLDYGFRNLRLHKIVAETNDYIKALNLMKKLGMTLEGTRRKHSKGVADWCDLYWCGILKEEYISF